MISIDKETLNFLGIIFFSILIPLVIFGIFHKELVSNILIIMISMLIILSNVIYQDYFPLWSKSTQKISLIKNVVHLAVFSIYETK